MIRTHARLLAVAIACALACASARAADVYTNIAYPSPAPGAPSTWQMLDLYVPADSLNTSSIPDTYTIVLVHGGGYSTGDKGDISWICAALADQGFAVISPNYQLQTPSMTAMGVGVYPQPTCDILNVVHWVRADGHLLNLPQRVILGGFSAGATISLHAAMGAGNPRFNVLPPAGAAGYTIDGAIGGFGRYDLTWNTLTFGMPQYVFDYLGFPSMYTGPTASSWLLPSTWVIISQASAATLVGGCSPPTVLYQGDSDGLVPPGNTIRLQQAMNVVGAPVQTHIIPGVGHDYAVFGPTIPAQVQSFTSAAAWIAQQAQAQCGRTTPSALDPFGVCCASDGSCLASRLSACAAGWLAQPVCSPNPCPQPPPPAGSCCFQSGGCAVGPQVGCPGDWTAGGACTPNNCPQPPPPQGACCAGDGSCALSTHDACADNWIAHESCAPNVCAQPPAQGSCCATSGSCTVSVQSACAGEWLLHGDCSPNPCQQPPPPPQAGACCMGAICAVRMPGGCGPGQRFTAGGTACNVPNDHAAPCCNADFNQDGRLQVGDVFDYLNAWFAGDLRCIITGNFAAGPRVQEIFEFLNAWFAGC